MNVTKARIKLSALGTFTPQVQGLLREQTLGIDELNLDLSGIDILHKISLEVTNFGTSGAGLTINADTLVATIATGTFSKDDGGGIDADKQGISVADHRLVLMHIPSGPAGISVALEGAAFKLLASAGTFSLVAVNAAALIAGSGTWTLRGPTGLQEPAWKIGIYVFSVDG